MDRTYLKNLINLLESEIAVHDQKFHGMEVHAECKPRMEATLGKLKAELASKEADSSDAPA